MLLQKYTAHKSD